MTFYLPRMSSRVSSKNTIQFKGEGNSIKELMPLLKTHKADLIQWFEFNRLYDYLAPLNGWGREDYETWSDGITVSGGAIKLGLSKFRFTRLSRQK